VKQKTAKTVIDVLKWINETPHHFAAWDIEPGFLIIRGHGVKLRIPEEIQKQTRELVEPGGRVDARMFRPNAAGLKLLERECE